MTHPSFDTLEWTPVPRIGGWLIYHSDPKNFFYAPNFDTWVGAIATAVGVAVRPDDPRIQQILTNTEEILATVKRLVIMSQTMQEIIDANNAKFTADLTAMQADLVVIKTALAAAIPPVGSTVTQASVDTMTANIASLDTITAAFGALVPPVPVNANEPPPPPAA